MCFILAVAQRIRRPSIEEVGGKVKAKVCQICHVSFVDITGQTSSSH